MANANDVRQRRRRKLGSAWRPRIASVRGASRALIFFFLLVLAFGWGTLVAAAWDALSDQQARGELDPTW